MALLRTHPGVGMVVGLAFVLTVGPVERFPNSRKRVVSYWGLNPREHSRAAAASGWGPLVSKGTR